jgi:hypothetical protein
LVQATYPERGSTSVIGWTDCGASNDSAQGGQKAEAETRCKGRHSAQARTQSDALEGQGEKQGWDGVASLSAPESRRQTPPAHQGQGVSKPMPEEVTLEFIGRELERLSSEVVGLKDQMTVLTAMMRRLDDTVIALTDEVRGVQSPPARS